MEKVLVIGPFHEFMKRALAASFDERFSLEYITFQEEYGRIADADYIILRTLNLNADDVAAMKKAKLIQRWGAGYDTVDIRAAEKKIPVAVTYGINAVPGKLLGAGLDAVEEETIGRLSFRGLGNVVLSAHLGGNTADNAIHIARRCAEQIDIVSAGGTLPPPHAVNLDLMESH